MNAAEAVRRIHKEVQDWRGEGAEVSWTKNGLNRALTIVRTLAKEEKMRALERRPRLSRWLAGDLYRAIRQALAYLERGDRAKGIETLQKAIELVSEAKKDGVEVVG